MSQVFAAGGSNGGAGAIAMRLFDARSFERRAMYFEKFPGRRVSKSILRFIPAFVMRGTQRTCVTLTRISITSHLGPDSRASSPFPKVVRMHRRAIKYFFMHGNTAFCCDA